MSASNIASQTVAGRFAFIETLSSEFLSRTGFGVYVFLNPLDVDQLFEAYCGGELPILAFARQCVRKTLA
ncbi:MAG: hypothetical protein PHH11_04825 [Methylomonas sp.]|nr:hypothetical protein [Methylomonas sp.]